MFYWSATVHKQLWIKTNMLMTKKSGMSTSHGSQVEKTVMKRSKTLKGE